MQKTRLLILLVTVPVLISLVICQAISSASISTDKSALLALKESMNSHVLTSNWSGSSSICSWIGVTCGRRHRRITALNISNMGLRGRIPSHLGNLSFLVSLDISGNDIYDYLPEQLAYLRRLNYLNASSNNFNGSIPEWFSFLPELRHLDLSFNHFTGEIPALFSNITKIKTLVLEYNLLQGHIPSEIGNLQKLKSLNFQHNQLIGSAPDTIFKISSLQVLGLTNNSLSGNLPKDMCSNVTDLRTLSLSFNQFEGQIPSGIYKCSRLQLLSLSYNNFSGGIPRQIGNLSNLARLYLGHNNLQGEIPPEMGNLHHLELLNLVNASLSGEIPPTIFNISTVTEISLSLNNLSGRLPENLGLNLQSLEGLYLGGNWLTGTIPESISNASRLTVLSIPYNNLTGSYPISLGSLKFLQGLYAGGNDITSESSQFRSLIDSLSNCQQLRQLWIGKNPLGVMLPASIGNLSTSLERLDISGAAVSGRIPDEIGNLSSLAFLYMKDNQLTGSTTIEIGRLSKLQGLTLAGNRITGLIPNTLCNLKNLGGLSLKNNKLYGSVPSCLGNISSLRYLYLGSNMLNSTIAKSLWNLPDLLDLDMSSNLLSGYLPPEVGNLRVAIRLILSENQFSGKVPSTIGRMQDMIYLSFAFNRLEGAIPESFRNMIVLKSLDLSHNNLSGVIPKALEALSDLEYFNVSFNRLSGEVPNGGPFANFTYESFMSNEALCGAPQLKIPACTANPPHKKKKRTMPIVPTLVVTVCIIALMAIIFILIRREKVGRLRPQSDNLLAIAHKRISYHELEQATDGFSETNLLGVGSFGSVYKAEISGASIAVKVFKLQLEGAFRSFDTECEVLRNLRHRNLVKVISSCSNIDFRALILDYMPNGSLENWLHTDNYFLEFSRRLEIMIDVASALDYLHNSYSLPVVHCDLKPSNILLDKDMVGHVSDFGMAKILGLENTIAQTNTIATIGYIAPEYGSEGLVSTKCDTYSYGIILMETFTGKRPTHEMFAGELSMKNWVIQSLPDALTEIVDAKFLRPLEGNFTSAKMHCISSIMEIALKCTAESPEERMNIEDVLPALKNIRIHLS